MLNKLYNTLETIPETIPAISSIPTANSIQDVDWLSIAGQSLSCLAPDESDLWKITLYKQGKYIKEQQSLVINFYISTNTALTQQHCSQLSICREYRLALFFSLGTKKGTEIELQIVWMEAEGGEKVFFFLHFFKGFFFMMFFSSWFIPVWSTSARGGCQQRLLPFRHWKAGLFFDLARNKLFTVTECTTLDSCLFSYLFTAKAQSEY